MTHWLHHLQAALILGPILALLLIGAWLTLRSGAMDGGHGLALKQVLENGTQAVLYLVACGAGLALAHRMVGLQFPAMW